MKRQPDSSPRNKPVARQTPGISAAGASVANASASDASTSDASVADAIPPADAATAARDDGWLRDADAIYAESFRIIAREADFSHLAPSTHHIAARVIHACGLPQLAQELRISPNLQKTVENALLRGCHVYTDTEMTRAGIMQRLLPRGVELRCLLRDAQTRHLAQSRNTTLTAAAVERWQFQPERAVCIIGNAPTALFRLMERMAAAELKPAAVLAFPVGFVGAAESKQAWHARFMHSGHEGATMLGRAGGAGMAAAAINAILMAMHAQRDA